MRPVIGITCSFESTVDPQPRARTYLNAAYSDAIYAAGGLPFLFATPPDADEAMLDEFISHVDGLLFTGGPDLDPRHYGQAKHAKTEVLHPRRDAFDIELFRAADRRDTPTLSICLGCQIAAVARGGCLVQHVDDLPRSGALRHYGENGASEFHDVAVESGSGLARISGSTRFRVNSRHHQLVDRANLGGRLRPVAFAPDGVVEAAEDPERSLFLAVQWHPEDMTDRPEHLNLFRALVEAARATRAAASKR